MAGVAIVAPTPLTTRILEVNELVNIVCDNHELTGHELVNIILTILSTEYYIHVYIQLFIII